METDPHPSYLQPPHAPEGVTGVGRLLLKIFVAVFRFLFGIPLLLLALTMVVGPPVSLIWQTIDMARMQERTLGRVDEIGLKSGGHGTARASIAYHFTANGRVVRSTRYAPGFVANWMTWSGGGKTSREFAVGRQVPVYFSSQRPERCALEYGWFFGSVGMTMIFGGGAVQARAASLRAGRLATCLKYIGQASLVYGFALLFVGPPVVRVFDLPWHGLAWVGALVVALLNGWYQQTKTPRVDGRRRNAN